MAATDDAKIRRLAREGTAKQKRRAAILLELKRIRRRKGG